MEHLQMNFTRLVLFFCDLLSSPPAVPVSPSASPPWALSLFPQHILSYRPFIPFLLASSAGNLAYQLLPGPPLISSSTVVPFALTLSCLASSSTTPATAPTDTTNATLHTPSNQGACNTHRILNDRTLPGNPSGTRCLQVARVCATTSRRCRHPTAQHAAAAQPAPTRMIFRNDMKASMFPFPMHRFAA